MTRWIITDVESDGPCPGTDMYSMISLGSVVLSSKLDNSFYGITKPISPNWIPEALAISEITRGQHEEYDDPKETMVRYKEWLESFNDQVVFVSDNPAFDWQFVNYYFHRYLGANPFGFSARRIGDLYAGLRQDIRKTNEYKKFRKTKHTHNPVDDARGNAEALLEMAARYGLENLPIAKDIK